MLTELLKKDRDPILAEWRRALFAVYPASTARFLQTQTNEFANPVGHDLLQCAGQLFDELTTGLDLDRSIPRLDGILRIRAVQEFAPSKALEFLLDLKRIVRARVAMRPDAESLGPALSAFEHDVDQLLLAGFDVYMSCREKINQIAQVQMRRSVHVLLKRAGMGAEHERHEPSP